MAWAMVSDSLACFIPGSPPLDRLIIPDRGAGLKPRAEAGAAPGRLPLRWLGGCPDSELILGGLDRSERDADLARRVHDLGMGGAARGSEPGGRAGCSAGQDRAGRYRAGA